MSEGKPKFYELSAAEREGEKLKDIYRMMSQQDRSLAELLEKYGEKYEKESEFGFDSKTIDVNREGRSLQIKKDRSGSQMDRVGFKLPMIEPVSARQPRRKNIHKNKPVYNLEKNPYFFQLKSQDDKMKMKQVLQKVYFTQKNSKLNRSRSKLQSAQKYTKQPQKLSPSKSYQLTSHKNNAEQLLIPQKSTILPQKQQNELPMPLGYFREDLNKDDSSSEEGDVPLTYYQREYKAVIRAQCLEETNFLYFSKNQAMKDWTENLLLLFEKHDKQLSSLRRKCKYLQKFDDNYFSVDIFRDS